MNQLIPESQQDRRIAGCDQAQPVSRVPHCIHLTRMRQCIWLCSGDAVMFREVNFQKCKTYLGWSENGDQAVLIDPIRDKIERYLGLLSYMGLRLGLIVDT